MPIVSYGLSPSCARHGAALTLQTLRPSRIVRVALALAACVTIQAPPAWAYDTQGIEGYPSEPAAQWVEAEMTVETGGMTKCDANLGEMATMGANEYAAKGNPAAAEYAGPMGGFFEVGSGSASLAGVCAVSCLKLPLGSEIVDPRAATTMAASKTAAQRRVYATPREELVEGGCDLHFEDHRRQEYDWSTCVHGSRKLAEPVSGSGIQILRLLCGRA